ncbi:MAG: LptF/LptG family permease [Rickettsiales bacterium]|nr:LptF/LptG family permease [Rickettsiales bacterium]
MRRLRQRECTLTYMTGDEGQQMYYSNLFQGQSLTVINLCFILRHMKIINRYFKKQLVTVFIMLLLVLTGLAWMLQIMSMMKFILNYGVDIGNFMGLTSLMIPFIVSIIIPFVTFIAIIFIYNKLISDNEITVLAASGLSPRQIAGPALSLAVFMTVVNLILNIWIVPATQSKFYDTQWELRYGLAHMKLQEAAFTEISSGLVVYVDKVSGHDLSQVMLTDARDPKSELTIFAEKGKLVATSRGLSIVMINGSLQSRDENLTVGTFDTFDMDLNVADKAGNDSFKVRRISTWDLLKSVTHQETKKQHKLVLTEICTRFLSPIMNLILAALCAMILLRSSLLRRRASFAPAVAVAAMAGVMALFMTVGNIITTLTELGILILAQGLVLAGILYALFRK